MKNSTHVIAALFLGCFPLAAQNTVAEDPFVRKAATKAAPTNSTPKYASICYEAFSLDLADAAALYRQKLGDGKLYAELTARVAKGKAKQESFAVVRTKSGQRANLESISEFTYPTEFAPPVSGTPKSPTTPIGPCAFETRNVGFSLDVEATISDGDDFVDLRLSPQTVTLADRISWGQGASQTELPLFETQRVTTSLTLISGQPQLACTPSRPPVSKADADSANRVWFSFVTVDIISVIKE